MSFVIPIWTGEGVLWPLKMFFTLFRNDSWKLKLCDMLSKNASEFFENQPVIDIMECVLKCDYDVMIT